MHGLRGAGLLCTALALAMLGCAGGQSSAASPDPVAPSAVVLTVEPMLGGRFRPGSWVALAVTLENNGPTVQGELRLAPATGTASTYGVPVELASGARQRHYLYGRKVGLGDRFNVTLSSGSTTRASAQVRVDGRVSDSLNVFLVAEQPEALAGPILQALAAKGGAPPELVNIGPDDLPPRVEAWSAVDVLVWQDIDTSRLDSAQFDALRIWALMGGDLIILGGTTGEAGLGALPADMLPYVPAAVVDVALSDLEPQLGNLPEGTTPAFGGLLQRGTALLTSGGQTIAARAPYGQGSVTLVGFDPSVPVLAGAPNAAAFWSGMLPPSSVGLDARLPADDQFLINAMSGLPAVQLPRSDLLLMLIIAYIVVIGPLNYLLLKRRDRRELAWLTMPLTIATFSIAAFGAGLLMRGSNVVVNELVVVHGAAGTDRGLADVRVGVFSPGRARFDVKVGGGVLITAPATSMFGQPGEQPIDVLLGDPATVRGLNVGYGSMRAFRAQASVAAPRVEADLRLEDMVLEGSLTNASGGPLIDVAVVYAGGVQRMGDMAAGETRPVRVRPGIPEDVFFEDFGFFGNSLAWQMFPPPDFGGPAPADVASARSLAARRALMQHLEGGWQGDWSSTSDILSRGPVILAWQPEGVLEVDVGSETVEVAETLYVLPARVSLSGHVVFSEMVLRPAATTIDSMDGWNEGGALWLSRGTVTMDYRPLQFDGRFEVSGLSIRLGFGEFGPREEPFGDAVDLSPLPDDEQPDSDAPLASTPRAGEGDREAPRLQLFDRRAGRWIEFEPLQRDRTYSIPDPASYVDEQGAFRVRFVVRGDNFAHFSVGARLEGDIE